MSQTGEVYFARNPTLPLPPASTTKLLTASDRAAPAVARRGAAGQRLRQHDAAVQGVSEAGLAARPARDLLYALLLHSANDAAVVIAEGVAGSVPSFARLMNTTARSLGATAVELRHAERPAGARTTTPPHATWR